MESCVHLKETFYTAMRVGIGGIMMNWEPPTQAGNRKKVAWKTFNPSKLLLSAIEGAPQFHGHNGPVQIS